MTVSFRFHHANSLLICAETKQRFLIFIIPGGTVICRSIVLHSSPSLLLPEIRLLSAREFVLRSGIVQLAQAISSSLSYWLLTAPFPVFTTGPWRAGPLCSFVSSVVKVLV
jgi:hypothetical protein